MWHFIIGLKFSLLQHVLYKKDDIVNFFFFFYVAFVLHKCRELTRNSQPVRDKNRENTTKKTITRTRQYLRGSVICLHSWSCSDFTIIKEKYKMAV